MDTIFDRARMPYGTAVSIAVAGGRIASIGTDAIDAPIGVERVDLHGALVVPGLIDGHIHLDKTFVGDRWRPHRPCTSGFDVRERVTFEKELLADSAPAETRVASLIELAVSRGTTHMRSHVDVDSAVGLRNLETVCAARERYRDCVSIEIVAFPQSGIMTNPGTAELLDAAVREGADLVGGLDPAGFDKDIEGHLATVFGIAERRDVGIDLHLHDPDALGISELEAIAERTKALGMQGRVAVSHAYALGDVPIDTVRRTAAKLADAGVAIMTNAPGNRAFPPVLALRDEGVTVFLGNDNIQDSWWPYGDADMLERTMIVGYRSGFLTDDELEIAFDLASASAARVLRLPDYGLVVGARADFVALDARHVPEAVVTRPAKRSVYKSGRLVACNGRFADPDLAHGMHAHWAGASTSRSFV